MINILTSAQAFGYGPCSKLVNIVKKYKKINKDAKFNFIGEDVALTYAKSNNVFDNIYNLEELHTLDPQKYQKVISVMDPQFALWGFINKIESIYVDSLYWYWNWKEDYLLNVKNLIKELEYINNYRKASLLLNNLEPHHQQYVGHFLSDKSLVQTFFDGGKKNKSDKYRANIKPITIKPIVDSSHKKDLKRDTIVISLAGFLSPLNREQEAKEYFKFIISLFGEIIDKLPPKIKILCTVNPKLLESLKGMSGKLKVTSLNNEELLKLLNKAIIIFTPAGVTTTYEALEYNVPIAYLPEQHDGHYQNFQRITKGINKKNNKNIIFPNLLINNRIKKEILDDPDSEINRIKNLIRNINNKENSIILNELKKCLASIIETILDKEAQNKLLRQQKKIVFFNIKNIGYNVENVIM
jgi:hypothetical protein